MTAIRTWSFVLAAALLATASSAAGAADLSSVPPPPEGVACNDPSVPSFPSVWLGHFSGGESFYPGPGSSIQLDWRDETLCFPSDRSCNRFMHTMRRTFHRPEGYFTCLPIR